MIATHQTKAISGTMMMDDPDFGKSVPRTCPATHVVCKLDCGLFECNWHRPLEHQEDDEYREWE
jgi:hypothetical protein